MKLVGILVLSSVELFGQAEPPTDDIVRDEKAMFYRHSFQGRFVAFIFDDVHEDERDRLILQFKVQKQFALPGKEPDTLVRIQTEALVNLDALDDRGYVNVLQESIPWNLSLGNSYLTALEWDLQGGGYSILNVKTYSPESEAAFLKTHRDEMIYHDFVATRSQLTIGSQKMKSVAASLDQRKRELEGGAFDAKATQEINDWIHGIQSDLAQEMRTLTDQIDRFEERCRRTQDHSDYAYEREKAEMILNLCRDCRIEIQDIARHAGVLDAVERDT